VAAHELLRTLCNNAFGLHNPQLLNLVANRVFGDMQRTRGLGLIPAAIDEGLANELLLQLIHALRQRGARHGLIVRPGFLFEFLEKLRRQKLGQQHLAFGLCQRHQAALGATAPRIKSTPCSLPSPHCRTQLLEKFAEVSVPFRHSPINASGIAAIVEPALALAPDAALSFLDVALMPMIKVAIRFFFEGRVDKKHEPVMDGKLAGVSGLVLPII